MFIFEYDFSSFFFSYENIALATCMYSDSVHKYFSWSYSVGQHIEDELTRYIVHISFVFRYTQFVLFGEKNSQLAVANY